jgi:hypothetical protein
VQALIDEGEEHLAENLDGPPDEFPEWARHVWDAFFILTSSRPTIVSMRIIPAGGSSITIPDEREGRIPFVAIEQYARRFHIRDDDFPEFLALLTALDLEFLKIRAEQKQSHGDGP